MSAVMFNMTGWDAGPWAKRMLKVAPELDLRVWPEIGDPAEIDYALVWKPDSRALMALPNLKVIFSLGAGVDHILSVSPLPDVPIVRIVDANLTNRMSEYVVLHCLMALRKQRLYDAHQAKAEWVEHSQPAAEEVRCGVMGYGVLGRDAATKLKMIGFDVAAWSRTAKESGDIPVYHGDDGLRAFLNRTDILISLLPLTPATTDILNSDLLRQLAPDGVLGGPMLINAGRGGSQVEEDILAALDAGVLAHATLDVFKTEPLPNTHPFWRHPKVTITPHNAAVSDSRALVLYIIRQMERFERGEPLENVIDRAAGY